MHNFEGFTIFHTSRTKNRGDNAAGKVWLFTILVSTESGQACREEEVKLTNTISGRGNRHGSVEKQSSSTVEERKRWAQPSSRYNEPPLHSSRVAKSAGSQTPLDGKQGFQQRQKSGKSKRKKSGRLTENGVSGMPGIPSESLLSLSLGLTKEMRIELHSKRRLLLLDSSTPSSQHSGAAERSTFN